MEAKWCDYNGAVGKCGLFVGYDPAAFRCKKHEGKPQRELRNKIGKYSGPSDQRKAEGFKTPGREE